MIVLGTNIRSRCALNTALGPHEYPTYPAPTKPALGHLTVPMLITESVL